MFIGFLTAVEDYSHGHWEEQGFIWIWSLPASTATLTHADWMSKESQLTRVPTMRMCVQRNSRAKSEGKREAVGLKHAHHDIQWNFLQHTRIPQPPYDSHPLQQRRSLTTQYFLLKLASLSLSQSRQTPSADNHSFGCVFDSFVPAIELFAGS